MVSRNGLAPAIEASGNTESSSPSNQRFMGAANRRNGGPY
jgi:hypothetical protein